MSAQRNKTHLLIVRARDGRLRLGSMPLPRRAMIHDSRRLAFRSSCNALEDGLLVVGELAKAGSCSR